jgi:NAD-dependent dihydropyrimidine dehydrogenase PreA subunit
LAAGEIGRKRPVKKRIWQGRPAGPWITARKAVQYVALFAFLLLFLLSKQGGWAGDLVNLPMRLDPLLMLAHLLSSRTFLLGSSLALLVILLTVVFGRAWCGWICPLGTTLDLFSLKRKRDRRSPFPEGWRKVKYGLLLTTLAAALLGNLTLLVFDPLTIFFRSLSAAIWPAIDWVVTGLESLLFQVPLLSTPVAIFDQWVRPGVFPIEPLFYRDALLFAAVFGGVIALNWIAPRFWCRYLCPLGGLLGLISKFALFRREVGEACKGCTLCTSVCPTGTIDPQKGYASDPAECTLCLDCLETCPRSLIAFSPRLSLAGWNVYDPGRRDALLAIGGAVAGVALFRSNWLAKREPAHLLRPPGVRQTNPDLIAFSKCIRCAECVRACPTQALQPAVFDAGLEGLWTPVLIPRMGYCDYSCNACGQVCPVQAIPALSLDEKRQTVIGKAYIDQNRCIAWSDHRDCIVCEEMCPLPDKAIQLEEAQVWGPDNTSLTVKLPHVLRDRCIGCGICEYKCPVNGEAAIRVFVPETAVPF